MLQNALDKVWVYGYVNWLVDRLKVSYVIHPSTGSGSSDSMVTGLSYN